jgi:hypothetical protein
MSTSNVIAAINLTQIESDPKGLGPSVTQGVTNVLSLLSQAQLLPLACGEDPVNATAPNLNMLSRRGEFFVVTSVPCTGDSHASENTVFPQNIQDTAYTPPNSNATVLLPPVSVIAFWNASSRVACYDTQMTDIPFNIFAYSNSSQKSVVVSFGGLRRAV